MNWRDVAERVIWTFVQAATSALAMGPWLKIEAWEAALLAGGAAVLSLIKNVAKSRLDQLGGLVASEPAEIAFIDSESSRIPIPCPCCDPGRSPALWCPTCNGTEWVVDE